MRAPRTGHLDFMPGEPGVITMQWENNEKITRTTTPDDREVDDEAVTAGL